MMHARVKRAIRRRAGSLSLEGQPERHTLEHDLELQQLEHFARLKRRRALERDFLFRRKRQEIERVLSAFDWSLEGERLTTAEPPSGALRAVAWNIERGKRFEALSGRLDEDDELRSADLLLLTEVDIGMGRSGNRHVARELAEQLGMGYVYANHHLVLAKGDSGEQDHSEPNTLSLHGSALLTRYPVTRIAAVSLPEHVDKFHVFEQRLGSKRALFAEVILPDGPLTVVVTHLDPFAPPRHRAYQMRLLLEGLVRFGGRRVLLGGDLNTNTDNLSNGPSLMVNLAYKLARYGVDGTVRQYLNPDARYERRLFRMLREVGLETQDFNSEQGTFFYDTRDPHLRERALDYVPELTYERLQSMLEPWGGVLPLRLDWFAGYGLSAHNPRVIEQPLWRDTHLISDHSPVLVDVPLEGLSADPITGPPRQRRPRLGALRRLTPLGRLR